METSPVDLDNQSSTTTNTSTDSTMSNFGGSVNQGSVSAQPDFDMDAINQAVMAAGNAPSIQNTFDVNDISLDDTPTTQHELDQRMSENPNLNLAGGGNVSSFVDYDNSTLGMESNSANVVASSSSTSTSIQDASSDTIALDNNINGTVDTVASNYNPNVVGADVNPVNDATPTKPEPVATFVDGDIVDEPTESPAEDAKAEEAKANMEAAFGQANVDPLNVEKNNKSSTEIANQLGAPDAPVNNTSNSETANNTAAPTGEPAHIANTITSPERKKSKIPILVGIGIVAIVAIIIAILFIFVIK